MSAPDLALRRSPPAPQPAILVGAFAFIVSAAGSATPSLWSDEIATLRAAQLSWPKLFVLVGNLDAVHAAYYSFMHVWIGAFGTSAFALRTPSALAVGMAAALLVVLGGVLASARVGLFAGVAFAVLPRVTFMGAEARSYAFTALAATLLTLVFVLALRGTRRLMWFLYAVLAAVSIYLFAYLAMMLVVHGLSLAVARPRRRQVVAWLVAAVAALFAGLPLLLAAWAQKGQLDWLARVPAVTPWTVLVEQWFDTSWATALVGWAVLVTFFARAGALRRSRPEWSLALPVLWFLAPSLLLFAADLVAGPLYAVRYLSFCTPAVALLIAMACAQARAAWAGWLVIAIVAVAALPTYVAQRAPYAKPGANDFAGVASLIRRDSKPGDAVAFEPANGAARLALEGYRSDFAGLKDIELVSSYANNGTLRDTTIDLAAASDRLAGVRALWLVATTTQPLSAERSDRALLTALGFSRMRSYQFSGEELYLFRRGP